MLFTFETTQFNQASRSPAVANSWSMLTVGVSWGYILEEDPVGAWGATHVIDHPSELIAVMVEDLITN